MKIMLRKLLPSIQRSNSSDANSVSMASAQPSDMVAVAIPVLLRLKKGKADVPGMTDAIGIHRLRLLTDQILKSGCPLALQFRMGSGICYLNVAGQVISCIPADIAGAGKYLVEVQLSAVREFEQHMLQSALAEVIRDPSARRDSLLTIHGTRDTLAEEATRLFESVPHASPTTPAAAGPCAISADPPWVAELQRQTKPYWDAVLECRLIQEASKGVLSLERMRGWILQMYPFIETFPKWIALTIAKVPDLNSRGFMIDNLRVEKRHAMQWVQMAEGFGLNKSALQSVEPFPEVDALTHWLWSINAQGSLAEAVGATNYAVEGVTQGIARLTLQGFPHYAEMPDVHLDRKAYAWMQNHARYDELHPVQALEVMKLYTTRDLEEKVIFASRRSLEYLLMALEGCYTRCEDRNDPFDISHPHSTARSRID
jgi:pyrroloquinoline quinone (PQQ) biosynthesis protein C